MKEDVAIELSLLLENGLIDQFEKYEIPSDMSSADILEGTSKSVGRLLKMREDLKAAMSLIDALDRLTKKIEKRSISRSKVSQYIALFEGLIYCMEDQRLENARATSFTVFKQALDLFEFTGSYLLIKQLFKRVSDGEIKVTYEPQVLAWLIDLYRHFLAFDEASIFRDELTFFYKDISKVNYREVELCFQYFIAVALLVQFQATKGFNKELLRVARDKVLDPIYAQVSDFRTLEQLENEQKPKFEHLDFLLYTLTHASRVIKKFLSEK